MHFERRGGVTPLLIRRGVSVPIQPLERPLVMNKIHDGCGVMEGFPFIVGVGIARPRIKRDVSENRRARNARPYKYVFRLISEKTRGTCAENGGLSRRSET